MGRLEAGWLTYVGIRPLLFSPAHMMFEFLFIFKKKGVTLVLHGGK